MQQQELTLDADGRPALDDDAEEAELDYETRAFDKMLPLDCIGSIVADCEAVYLKVTTTTRGKGIEYTTNATYWASADMRRPRTALEGLALQIFEQHTHGVIGFDRSRSGAEWWTQVVDADSDIGFHWDRDYELQRDEGICVHPHVATVTYLNGEACGGSPTIVLPVVSPVQAAEVAEECVGPVHEAFACWPEPGRHLAFDGRLLHGVPTSDQLVNASESPQSNASAKREPPRKRVTLLVNCWLNHVPGGADPLPTSIAKKLSTRAVAASWSNALPPNVRHLVASSGAGLPDDGRGKTRMCAWDVRGFGQEMEAEGDLMVRLPSSDAWARMAPLGAHGNSTARAVEPSQAEPSKGGSKGRAERMWSRGRAEPSQAERSQGHRASSAGDSFVALSWHGEPIRAGLLAKRVADCNDEDEDEDDEDEDEVDEEGEEGALSCFERAQALEQAGHAEEAQAAYAGVRLRDGDPPTFDEAAEKMPRSTHRMPPAALVVSMALNCLGGRCDLP